MNARRSTETRGSEVQGRQSLDRIRDRCVSLFGHLRDAVAISRSGRVLYANERMHDLLGAADGELLGLASLELYPDAEHTRVLTQIQSMVFSGEPHDPAPLALLRRDGSTTEAEIERLVFRIGDERWLLEIARVGRAADLPCERDL